MTGELVELRLPDLGEGLTEATIVQWLVAVGDQVAVNQPLCELETEKATVEVPSPATGTIARLGGTEGEALAVGALLVAITPDAQLGAPPVTTAGAGLATATSPGPELVGPGAPLAPSPLRRRRAALATSAPPGPATGPSISPLRRRRAAAQPAAVAPLPAPSGPGAGAVPPAPPGQAAPAAPSVQPGRQRAESEAGQVVPFGRAWQSMADRMARSQREVPAAAASLTVDASALLAVAAALTGEAEAAGSPRRITPFAVILRAVALSLVAHPRLNAHLEPSGRALRLYPSCDVAVAVDTPAGLVAPVITGAQHRSLRQLADALEEVAAGARAGRLQLDQVGSGTFTVTNHGVFGTDDGHPVVVVPQVAILAVGAIRPRPFVVGGELAVRPTVSLTCVFDHRACDGATAGRFLAHLGRLLADPALLLLDA